MELYSGETWENYLTQVNKVNIISDIKALTLDMIEWKWHFTSVVLFLKTHNSCLTIKKSYITKLKNILYNTLPVLLKTFKITKNNESLRNCHSLEEPKEIWRLNVVW